MRNQIISTVSAVVLATMFAAPSFATTYTDDAAISNWSKESVEILTDLGVMVGHADGEFKPADHLTREEYAVSLLNGLATLESLVTEAYQAEDAYLYEQLVAQQVTLLEALTAIDEIKAKDAVEHNNYFAVSMFYDTENDVVNQNGYISLDGKIQVVSLSKKLAISVRPFVNTTGEAGSAATLDVKVTDKLTLAAGAGVAGSWNDDSALAGDSSSVGYAQANIDYSLGKNSVATVTAKVPFTEDNSGNVNVGIGLGVRF